MFITEIILDGFKSFELRTIIKNLDTNYNAITGMNGSGKSNVLDGIIFALGIENLRLLRVNSYKELVNQKKSEGSVTLVLKDTNYMGYESLILCRSINKEGKTKYLLNGQPSSAATVQKILVKCGLSSLNIQSPYFVVMQGGITKVLNMKRESVRELVEETAGIRNYEIEREKAVVSLEKKERKLVETKDNLKRRVSPFYKKLNEERESYLITKRWNEKKEEILDRKKEISESLEIDSMGRRVLELNEDIKEYLNAERELENINGKLENIKKNKDGDETRKLQFMVDSLKEKIEDKKIKELEKNLSFELGIVNENPVDINELREKEKILFDQIKAMVKFGRIENENLVEEIYKLEIKKNGLHKNKKDICIEEKKELEGLVVEHEKYEKYKEKELELIKKRENIINNLNYPYINGVYGTVEENFSFKNKKYTEAIYSILGSRGKYVIVEDDRKGKEILKNNNLKISVIPLTKIVSKIVNSRIIKEVKKRGGLEALEVLEYHEEVKNGMEFIFNNFFIFEDEKEAKKCCFELNIVCVTLEGTVYDPRGTLSGGKVYYRKSNYSRNEIKEIDREIEIIKSTNPDGDINEIKNRLNEIQIIQRNNEELVKIEEKIRFYKSMPKINFKNELEIIRNKIVEESIKNKQIEENKQKFLRMQNDREKEEKELKRLKIERDEIYEEIDKLEQKIKDTEIKKKRRTIDEKDEAVLEPKKKYFMEKMIKMKSKINKKINDGKINEEIKEEFTNYNTLEDNIVKSYQKRIINDEEVKILKEEIFKIEEEIEAAKNVESVRMNPKNFDLLERNEEIIKNLEEKINILEKDKIKLNITIDKLSKIGKEEFKKALTHINKYIGHFLRFFIKDSDAQITEDFEISVKIGDWKDSIVELSGGQRSLVAISLIFSILKYKPSPFYLFDEIDAALDSNHTNNLGEIIKTNFSTSQFVVISLKDEMFSNANRLFRVVTQNGRPTVK
ncbi:Chromosome segregation protein [Spraguea lophii 42_110]|uniref:Chromosome segregation protein n=1 Tax=Spraguea lophii (strain 42_110) TaxID=1358809 RepID=S7WCA1_SPRLO|nr:Chromosome segregation protein [Spraguea lophii 42_110]